MTDEYSDPTIEEEEAFLELESRIRKEVEIDPFFEFEFLEEVVEWARKYCLPMIAIEELEDILKKHYTD